jgi:hypothetical protein
MLAVPCPSSKVNKTYSKEEILVAVALHQIHKDNLEVFVSPDYDVLMSLISIPKFFQAVMYLSVNFSSVLSPAFS